MKNRTSIDFSEHEVLVTEHEGLLIHYLKKPGTITNSIKFINTNGIMAVTGDFGNWIFCREFHPSADGRVSDHYWMEKLAIASTQKGYDFDSEKTELRIKAMLNGGIEEYGYEGEEADEMKEYFEECLGRVEDETAYTQFAYQESPGNMDSESVIFCEKPKIWLQIIFDGFDYICNSMKELEEIKS